MPFHLPSNCNFISPTFDGFEKTNFPGKEGGSLWIMQDFAMHSCMGWLCTAASKPFLN